MSTGEVGDKDNRDSVIGLFPTPVMVCRGAIDRALVDRLVAQFDASDTAANNRTHLLRHTPVAHPASHPNFEAVCAATADPVRRFGATLLGETLDWQIKAIWINRMARQGAQKIHNHANSFISGILYLTAIEGASATVFHRAAGGTGFVMDNTNERTEVNAFNAPVFRAPDMAPGDLLLFPSYLMHEVPPSPVDGRMTVAFNAIPAQLDSWGYRIALQ